MARKRTDAPAPTRRILLIAGSSAVALGLAAATLLGLPRLAASTQARLAASPTRLSLAWPDGNWLPQSERDRLMAIAVSALDAQPDPLRPAALARLGRALDDTGWFDRVGPIRRLPGGAVTVEAAWRVPVAVVRRDATDYLVSRDARVLPIAYPAGSSAYQAILGVHREPPLSGSQIAAGGLWPGDDIRAALDLLLLASSRPWRSQLAAVDASDYHDRKRLVLVTTTHGRAVWGGAPADSLPGEVSAIEKLRRLDALHARFGQIDAKHRLVEIGGPMLLVDNSATAEAP